MPKCKTYLVQVIIARDYRHLSETAAGVVAGAVIAKPQLALCLPTGNTPKGLYRELIRLYREKRIDFSRVSFFNLDEYLGLRADHTQSFRAYLWREFLNYVNVRRANVYAPDENYEETIRRAGSIDLLISGIGTNGHIAFNEPGSSKTSRTRIVELAQSTLQGMRQHFAPGELPTEAITVGIGTVLEARRVLLLASGHNKADVFARALTERPSSELPASFLQNHPNVTAIADEDAARVYKDISHERIQT